MPGNGKSPVPFRVFRRRKHWHVVRVKQFKTCGRPWLLSRRPDPRLGLEQLAGD